MTAVERGESPGRRRWPSASQYQAALQNPGRALGDPELRQGTPLRNAGLPAPFAGAFADVYQLECPSGDTWAVKCFKRDAPERDLRYQLVGERLRDLGLPFLTDFQWLDGERGVRVDGEWFPVVKMRWIEGRPLNEVVAESLGRPETLRDLQTIWARLASRLAKAGIAHGDLQHGNVLLVPESRGLRLMLVDYDGLFIPELQGRRANEAGHGNYQHPRRSHESPFDANLDRFSLLLVYTALHALRLGGRRLWERFDNGENLLFRQADLERPQDSELFRELWTLPEPGARSLVGRLALATQGPMHATPLLEELLGQGQIAELSRGEVEQVETLLREARVRRHSPDANQVGTERGTSPVALDRPGATGRGPEGSGDPDSRVVAKGWWDGRGRWVAGGAAGTVVLCLLVAAVVHGFRPDRAGDATALREPVAGLDVGALATEGETDTNLAPQGGGIPGTTVAGSSPSGSAAASGTAAAMSGFTDSAAQASDETWSDKVAKPSGDSGNSPAAVDQGAAAGLGAIPGAGGPDPAGANITDGDTPGDLNPMSGAGPRPPGPADAAAPVVSLAGFPNAVSLPKLGETAILGTTLAVAPGRLDIELLGGDVVLGPSGGTLGLAPAAGAEAGRAWQLVQARAGGRQALAELRWADDGGLEFAWSDQARANLTGARALECCALGLHAGSEMRVCALRRTVVVEPLTVRMYDGGGRVEWQLPSLPDPQLICLQSTGSDGGLPACDLEPPDGVFVARDKLTCIFHDDFGEKLRVWMDIVPTVSRTGIVLKATPMIRVAGRSHSLQRRYLDSRALERRARVLETQAQNLDNTVARLNDALAAGNLQNPLALVNAENQAAAVHLELDASLAEIEVLTGLRDAFDALDGQEVALHFRCLIRLVDQEVELSTTVAGASP